MRRAIPAAIGAVFILTAFSANAADIPTTPRESGAVISDHMTTKQVDALAAMVKLHGYKCDSVSAARPWVMSHGFTMYCNSYRYEYELRDKGGRWEVEVK